MSAHTPTPIGYILLRRIVVNEQVQNEDGSYEWKPMKSDFQKDYNTKRLYVSEKSALFAADQMLKIYPADEFKAIPVYREPSEQIESLRAERDGLVEALRDVRTVLYMCENSLLNCGYGVESSTIKSIQKAVAKLSKYAKK